MEQRRAQEDLEIRQRLGGWKRAFESSIPRAAAKRPLERPQQVADPLPDREAGRESSPVADDGNPADRPAELVSLSAMATSAGSWSPSRSAEEGEGSAPSGPRSKRPRHGASTETVAAAAVRIQAGNRNGNAEAPRRKQNGVGGNSEGEPRRAQAASQPAGARAEVVSSPERRVPRPSRGAPASVAEAEGSNLLGVETGFQPAEPGPETGSEDQALQKRQEAERALKGLSDIHAEIDKLLEDL